MPVKMCHHRWPVNGPGECGRYCDSFELRMDDDDYPVIRRRIFDGEDGRFECDELMSNICPFREWQSRRKRFPELYDRPKKQRIKCPHCGRNHFADSDARKFCEAWHKAQEIFKELKFHRMAWLPQGSTDDPYGHKFDKYSMTGARLWLHMRYAILERDEHRCQVCKRQSDKYDNGSFRDQIATARKTKWGYDHYDYLEVHHIIPKIKGGSDHPANLMTVCSSCHSRLTGRMLSNLAGTKKSEKIAERFGKGKDLLEEILELEAE
ncbi:MAG: HNH endonuclease [Methanoregulaceae archaeon]|nr:HNH endonuclease [Methanoregulaceae archaeon]